MPDDSPQLVHFYHNRLPHAITGVVPELLFARFAWSILADKSVPFFGNVAFTYDGRVYNPNTGQAANKQFKGSSVKVGAVIFPSVSKSRSVSPTKKRQLEDDLGCDSHSTLGSGTDAVADDGEQEFRGRPRKHRRDNSWPSEPVPNLVHGRLPSTTSPPGAVAEPLEVPVRQCDEKERGFSLSSAVHTTEQ